VFGETREGDIPGQETQHSLERCSSYSFQWPESLALTLVVSVPSPSNSAHFNRDPTCPSPMDIMLDPGVQHLGPNGEQCWGCQLRPPKRPYCRGSGPGTSNPSKVTNPSSKAQKGLANPGSDFDMKRGLGQIWVQGGAVRPSASPTQPPAKCSKTQKWSCLPRPNSHRFCLGLEETSVSSPN
jgi:hypothetical protein